MEAAAVGQGEVGEVADPMADLGREEEVVVVRIVTMTAIPMALPVVVQDGAVVVVAEQEGEEEVHHPRHPPGHLLPQMSYRTKIFSLVSPFFALHPQGLTLWNIDDDPPPPPKRANPPPKSNPVSKATKAAAPTKTIKTTTTTTATTTTTKPAVRPPPPAPAPSTSTVPYCECGYPALETSIILARGPPCKQWRCGNLGNCEFFQVDKNPIPVPLIPQKRVSSEHVRTESHPSDLLVSVLFAESCDQEGCKSAMLL